MDHKREHRTPPTSMGVGRQQQQPTLASEVYIQRLGKSTQPFRKAPDSKLSPSMFSFYIADMPRPTAPVKRVCYADDINVWATGVKIPDLENSINSYRFSGSESVCSG